MTAAARKLDQPPKRPAHREAAPAKAGDGAAVHSVREGKGAVGGGVGVDVGVDVGVARSKAEKSSAHDDSSDSGGEEELEDDVGGLGDLARRGELPSGWPADGRHSCIEDETCVQVSKQYGVDVAMLVKKNKLLRRINGWKNLTKTARLKQDTGMPVKRAP